MLKKYITPVVEITIEEDLCTTGMTSTSWGTDTENAASDQKDVTPGNPEVSGDGADEAGAKSGFVWDLDFEQ